MPTHARVIPITTEKVHKCAACGEPILPGEIARYSVDSGEVHHPECASDSYDEDAAPYRGSDT